MAFLFSFNVLPKTYFLAKLMFLTPQTRCKQVQSPQNTIFSVFCFVFLLCMYVFVCVLLGIYVFLLFLFVSYPTLPYPILPYPILSYPTLSYPTLSYPLSSTSPLLGHPNRALNYIAPILSLSYPLSSTCPY